MTVIRDEEDISDSRKILPYNVPVYAINAMQICA